MGEGLGEEDRASPGAASAAKEDGNKEPLSTVSSLLLLPARDREGKGVFFPSDFSLFHVRNRSNRSESASLLTEVGASRDGVCTPWLGRGGGQTAVDTRRTIGVPLPVVTVAVAAAAAAAAVAAEVVAVAVIGGGGASTASLPVHLDVGEQEDGTALVGVLKFFNHRSSTSGCAVALSAEEEEEEEEEGEGEETDESTSFVGLPPTLPALAPALSASFPTAVAAAAAAAAAAVAASARALSAPKSALVFLDRANGFCGFFFSVFLLLLLLVVLACAPPLRFSKKARAEFILPCAGCTPQQHVCSTLVCELRVAIVFFFFFSFSFFLWWVTPADGWKMWWLAGMYTGRRAVAQDTCFD